MARKSNTESVQETKQEVEQVVEPEVAEVVEDAVSITSEEEIKEAEVKEVEVEVEPEAIEEPKVETKKEETEPSTKAPKEELEAAGIIDEISSTAFQPTSLIPIYTRPASKYYDCRCKSQMKILDLQSYNGFVPVSVAVSGRGVCKYFVRNEHLPERLQSFIVAK